MAASDSSANNVFVNPHPHLVDFTSHPHHASVTYLSDAVSAAAAAAATAALDEPQDDMIKNTWLSASDINSPTSSPSSSPSPSPSPIMNRSQPASSTKKASSTLVEGYAQTQTKRRPLSLLDLPVDIMKDIVNEVTHTNDLTSLALCHSALHRLVIPHIYSRFDIVWPDSVTPAEPRTGVDALTYGLATLVMAEDVFGEPIGQSACFDRHVGEQSKHNRLLDSRVRRRRGNYYANFTRKFSLGNGPPEWVQEYLISKEGGKMLGTLVALAVARMRNLETFIWDMPTGILRDVWIALSSLGDRNDGQPCRLERIAVRFHDNSLEPHALPLHHPPPPGSTNPPLDYVERPSFSVLPPLTTLSVLDIDELQYLDEMSVLIGRSKSKLRELRVGIARHIERDWTQVWDGDQLHQVDKDHPTLGSITIGTKRLGGVLGVLTAWVSDMRRTYSLPHRPKRLRRRSNATVAPAQSHLNQGHGVESTFMAHTALDDTHSPSGPVEPEPEPEPEPEHDTATPEDSSAGKYINNAATTDSASNHVDSTPKPRIDSSSGAATVADEEDTRLCDKLSLETLELERVPLSIPVLQNVIDWSLLKSLTLLSCPNHEHLWKTLRRLYSPLGSNTRHYAMTDPSRSRQKASRALASNADYKLRLKKIHVDTVSPSLIAFIKETLAPNSLEIVFFQEASRADNTIVPIDSIFRGVLRRHRGSLKKVLIDSSERGAEGQPIANSRSKRWLLTRDMLEFITSGKMPVLRELGGALDYRDWHYFLQHLPSITHLRSLYIPYMANYIHGSFITEPRELALQIVDIVALRPDIELCYVGIAKKCFEILENVQAKDRDRSNSTSSAMTGPEDGEGDDVDEEDDMGDEDDDAHSHHSSSGSTEPADSDSEDEMTEIHHSDRRDLHLNLREILYYDDKISIFKARHGKL